MNMSIYFCLLSLVAFFIFTSTNAQGPDNTSFFVNYHVTWGQYHAVLSHQNTQIQLTLDNNSGSGFESNLPYGSGFFHARMRLPKMNSLGVVTAFYLTSHLDNHDEIDFEFLGDEGPPYTLQTNVYTNGQGGREQRVLLWFDPTKNFHYYRILWNQYQVVFFVDDVPIRVFKNNTRIGVGYPSQPMAVVGSIWNGEGWASGGKKIDWSRGPFRSEFQDFQINGCELQAFGSAQCSSGFPWNAPKHRTLTPQQRKKYENVRKKMSYDYCTDRSRYPTPPPECRTNH